MWNNINEHNLKCIGEHSACYRWMLQTSARYYITFGRIIGVIIIIFSGIVGTNYFISDSGEISTRSIIFGSISYLVGILSGIKEFIQPENTANEQLSSANKFQEIYQNIKNILAMKREDRPDANNFIDSIGERYNDICEYSPSINNFIINKFLNEFKNETISMPSIANKIEQIVIKSDADKQVIQLNHQSKKQNKYNTYQLERWMDKN